MRIRLLMIAILCALVLPATEILWMEDHFFSIKDWAQEKVTLAEMEKIADAVEFEARSKGMLEESDFSEFLEESITIKVGRSPSQDPWGTPYRLEVTPELFEVQSAGKDCQWYSVDDLVVESRTPSGLP